MQTHELSYIIRIKVIEDTPKARSSIQQSLERFLALKFSDVEVIAHNDATSVPQDWHQRPV